MNIITSKTKFSSRFSTIGIAILIALGASSLVSGSDATAGPPETLAGTQRIYGNIPPDQIEAVTTQESIKAAAAGHSMMQIWETLEHGEKLECLDCIPVVEPLLYDANPRTREIAAWWLRRRMFGVFGPGEVYKRTLDTLASDADPVRRAYAAEAVGEFLALPGIAAAGDAVKKDPDARVRAAAVRALGRLNDDGNGAVGVALVDADSNVKLNGLKSASRINGFKDVVSVNTATKDGSPTVRRNAADLLGQMRSADGYDSLAALANDPDADVRNAAAHALGALHDQRARPILDALANSDPNGLVRDAAQIALRRL